MPDSDVYQHIVNMMTLRYDPLEKPVMRLRGWQDFIPQEDDDYRTKVLSLVRRKLEDKVVGGGFKKVAIALSGGVDSTFILSLLKEVSPDTEVRAICATFQDAFDETVAAKRVADQFGCRFTILRIDDPFAQLEDLVRVAGEPRWNLYFYHVMKEASKGCELLLTGDGGDELFGGYTFRYSKFLSSLRSADTWHERVVNYLNCHERDWVPDQESLFTKKMGFSWETIYGLLRKHFDNPLSPLGQVLLADFDGKLTYDWVPMNKRLSEHLGIECYAALLEDDIIDLAARIPVDKKFDPGSNLGKLMLRDIMKSRGLTFEHQKIGFGMDLAQMWTRVGRAWVDRYVNRDSMVVREGIIDSEWLKRARAIVESEKSPRYINKLFSILSLELWLRLFPVNI